MNSERHYPTAFKFASVIMMTYAVWIFHQSQDFMIKLYSVIEFVAALNGWAASENDRFIYGDVFLLNDACCSACFFLTMLDLHQGQYHTFYYYGVFLFMLYYIWNRLLIRTGQSTKEELKSYQKGNTVGFIYSLFVSLLEIFHIQERYLFFAHIVGMIMWLLILAFWFSDNYFKEYKSEFFNNGEQLGLLNLLKKIFADEDPIPKSDIEKSRTSKHSSTSSLTNQQNRRRRKKNNKKQV